MADPNRPSSTEYFNRGEPVSGGRAPTGPTLIEQRLAELDERVAALDRVAVKLERLATLDSDVRDKAPARPDAKPSPQLSAALTRANLRVRVSYGVVGVGSIALTIGGVNVFSYAQGLAKGDEERTQVMAEAKAVRDQLDDHETRIAAAVTLQGNTSSQTASEIRRMSELQLLQWQYMAEVLEAIRRKREIPKKDQLLIDAESRALVSIRDGK